MSKKEELLELIRLYKASDESEKEFAAQMIDLIDRSPDAFFRTNKEAHITAGACLISPDGKKVLLTHHKFLKRWLFLGGHTDGDPDVVKGALREAEEESGMGDIRLVSKDILALDVHPIPENKKKNEPAHLHMDICFLFQAPTERFSVSDESEDLKWFTYEELLDVSSFDAYQKRIIARWRERMGIN